MTTPERTAVIAIQTHIGRRERDLPIDMAVLYCLDMNVELKIFLLFGFMFMYDAHLMDHIFNLA